MDVYIDGISYTYVRAGDPPHGRDSCLGRAAGARDTRRGRVAVAPTGKGESLRPRLRVSRFDLPASVDGSARVAVALVAQVGERGSTGKKMDGKVKTAGAPGPLVLARQGRSAGPFGWQPQAWPITTT